LKLVRTRRSTVPSLPFTKTSLLVLIQLFWRHGKNEREEMKTKKDRVKKFNKFIHFVKTFQRVRHLLVEKPFDRRNVFGRRKI
jgi:hypothetical protein